MQTVITNMASFIDSFERLLLHGCAVQLTEQQRAEIKEYLRGDVLDEDGTPSWFSKLVESASQRRSAEYRAPVAQWTELQEVLALVQLNHPLNITDDGLVFEWWLPRLSVNVRADLQQFSGNAQLVSINAYRDGTFWHVEI